MTLVQIATVLVVLSAAFGWINRLFVRLPHTIGLMVLGIVFSLGLVVVDRTMPGDTFLHELHDTLRGLDFFDALMNGMLSFLLFAAALHVDVEGLRRQRWPIAILATVGVVVSMTLVAAGLLVVTRIAGIDLPASWAFAFGALISPTDPVAVLSVMKRVKVAPSLEAKISGESLFNDGVGVIAYTLALAVATGAAGGGDGHALADADGWIDWLEVSRLFAVEVFGAIALGVGGGALTLYMTSKVDDAELETLLSIALVLGVYVGAGALHMSGPIAAVVAGLVFGNWGPGRTLSERTRDHLFPFWTMLDELLNGLLFMIVGLEIVAVDFDRGSLAVALACIPLVLAARAVSVFLPITILGIGREFTAGTRRLMTWGGVRGGISVALALSLPDGAYKDLVVHATFAVVVFSVIVQGLTIEPLIRSIARQEERKKAAGEPADPVLA